MMHLKSDSTATISPSVDDRGEGGALGGGDKQTSEHVEPVVSPPDQSAAGSVANNGFSTEVPASLHPSLQSAEMRLTKTLQHIYESTETRVLDALKQAAYDIIEHLGKQAAIQLVAAERRSAVLEQELKNTRSQALDMLVRLRYSAHVQRAEDERRVLVERRKALDADAKLTNVQETVKRAKAELKRKSEMLEELQKRVQLEDARAAQSASEGLDRRKRGSRTKIQANSAHEIQDKQSLVEQLSDQFVTLHGTQVSTADSIALREGEGPHSRRQRGASDAFNCDAITPEPESRVRVRISRRCCGAHGLPDCSNAVSAASEGADHQSPMNRQGLVPAKINKSAGARGIEQPRIVEVASTSRGESEAGNICGELSGHIDGAGKPACNGGKPVKGVSKDFQRSENDDHCDQGHDECSKKIDIYSSEKSCHSEGQEAQVQAEGQDCTNLMCLEQGALVTDVESSKPTWRVTTPPTSRQNSSPTNSTEQVATVAEQEPGNKAGLQVSAKRKRKEKASPENEGKRVGNIDSRQKSATCSQDVAGRFTESSRESRRLMQGARQLFSLRRGRDAD